ncbi:hypothetical protein PHYSODRAFT_344366 [Phytophthora sojae]|uniref:Uncharacterized protein n=1 Tax=Phytophthora sojae (strain P6497) TaxID=1094619 RepID=G4YT97_PHYSP|nr:hypothetical protein PHYSODRAFT_344366 [Phytophthora sojae]EGZ23019.1 hypothetical protein PHYSODRAFT_344366 [Phytophthora sojae]|eukprot:XP_009518307.1 hypothetical protein PHYSODRAFT_344366 [Phytophthora sojae]
MPPTPLATGDYLLVLPEDVKQAVGGAFYGVVMSMTRSSARVKSVTTTLPGTYTLAKSLAGRRRVPSSEAEGQQPGVWLRKAVCVQTGDFHYYGQVVQVKGERLCVSTYLGVKEWPVQQVAGEVYPVIALIMGSQRWAIRTWAFEALETAHDRLLDAILEGEANKPLPSSGLTAIVPELKERTDLHVEWLAADSGASHTTSLDHVLRYVYYVDGKREVPDTMRDRLGQSFYDEPSSPVMDGPASEGADSFFEPWGEEDDVGHVGGGHGDIPAAVPPTEERSENQLQNTELWRQTNASARSKTDDATGHSSTNLELEVIELLQKHRPDLLAPYLSKAPPAPARKRPIESEPSHASKKARCGFSPTTEQERAHMAITSDQHKAYDLAFGKHELSIMHFKRVGFLDKLRSLAPGIVNMSDYQVSAPKPETPSTWADLSSSTHSFVEYCRDLCDTTTVRVAEALDQFVLAMEGWKQIRDDELPILVLWIDATLEKYRSAVLQDLHDGTAYRSEAALWFSTANPEVHTLLFAVLGDRTMQGRRGPAAPSRSPMGPSDSPPVTGRRRTLAAERRIPADVVASIPVRDGKEVCLHYISQRGCNPHDPDHCTFKNRLHFVPASILPKLRNYITSRLGGVCKMLSDK